MSPGGRLGGTVSVAAVSGVASFTGLTIKSAGTFSIVAEASGINPGESAATYTITNSLSSIQVQPSATSVATGVSFNVVVTLIGEDGDDYSTACSVTITEDTGNTILGTVTGSITGTGMIGSMSIATPGIQVLVATCSSVTGYSSITVTDVNTVSLSYSGDLVVNHLITFTSVLYDATGNLVTTSQSGSLSGSSVTTSTNSGPSSTGIITYTAYFTTTGSKTVTVTHGGVTDSVTFTVGTNTAKITPSQDWGQELGSLTYTVSILYTPVTSETISITFSTTQFSLSASSLTFSAANTAQTVTVTILNTAAVGEWTDTITHTNSNMLFTSCSGSVSSGVFTLTLYDSVDVFVLISSSPVMSEGSSATYSVYLSSTPTASVTVAITGQSSLSFSPSSLTFSTTTSQTVTVTSTVSSVNEIGSNAYEITHTITSADESYANAGTIPTEVFAYVLKTTNPSVLISEDVVFQESFGGGYFIMLTSEPTTDVTVSLSSSGSTISYSPAAVVFTSSNYNTPQEITLSSITGSTPRYLKYSITITHTVTSGDSNYDSIVPLPSSSITVTAVHPCKAGMYAWPPGSGTCEPCPDGYKCPTLYEDKVACTSIQYSPLGVWNCINCPAGHSCSGTDLPVRCPDGYTSTWGTGVCSACSSNSCDNNGITVVSAPAGFYIMNNGHSIYQCPPGYYCSGGSASPTACSSGYYSTIGSSICTICPLGYYCPDKATPIPLLCNAYSYSAAGSTQCTYCPVGSSCTSTGATACTASQVSLEGWMQCLDCDVMCHDKGRTYCSLGKYYTGAACTACPVGYECDGLLRRPCAPGFYSASTGASACTKCGTGNYVNIAAQSACTAVTAGYMANLPYIGQFRCYRGTMASALKNSCIFCTIGSQCDDPTTPTSCTIGNFCNPVGIFQSSANNQQYCPSGYKNSNTGSIDLSSCSACSAGTYCPKGTSAGTSCPIGHYCPAYSYIPDNFPCPIGTINTSTSRTASTDCVTGTAGYYSYQGAAKEYPCIKGYYCPAGSNYPQWCSPGYTSPILSSTSGDCSICSAGQYCPPGSFSISCPAGTYNTNSGLGFLWDACVPCTAGYSCSAIGQTIDTTNACSVGHYCTQGTEFADQNPCPAGTYTDSTSLATIASCSACPLGYYCKIGSDSTRQVLCPRGHYCPLSTAYSHQYPCASGTYLWTIGNDASGDCQSCTAGRYCERGSSYISGYCSQGANCPSGTTRPDKNLCAAGTFNPFYNSTSSSDCVNCPTGYYCLQGAAHPLPCPPGTYASAVATVSYSSCTTCAAGKYCEAGSSAETTCPDGYYSAAGSFECYLCPGGYYCASGVQTSCTAGNYCPLGSSAATTCPAGYYCLAAASEATPCPAGKYRAATGATVLSDCVSSTAGYYSILGSSSDTGLCEPGFYCIAGSSGPYATPCPAGTYITAPGGSSSSSCLTCPAGYYCKLGTAFPVICPAGTYCVAGTSSPPYCPSGTIGLTEGLQADTDCTDCTEGSFCSQPGLLVADGNCVLGYICEAGSSLSTGTSTCPAGGYCQPGFPSQRACPPGTYNPDTGAKDITQCGKCDAGYYCLGDETAYGENSCAAGYYCEVGSYWEKQAITSPGYISAAASSSETKCAIGTYNRLYAQSICTNCDAGYYCDSTGMTEPIQCPIGNYCTTTVSTYTNCPVGTFNPRIGLKASANCLYCTAGKYCLSAGISTPTGLCDPGYYCKFGSSTKKPVDVSTASEVAGQCPVGFYCPQATPIPIACPTGTYLATILGTALSECTPCTAGSYCTNTGLSDVEGDCYAGYYCQSGSVLGTTVPRPTVVGIELNYCTYGQYCITGSSEPTECDGGYYQDELRQSTCKDCPAGYYCETGTGDFSALVCPAGYYCPINTEFSSDNPCPTGTYSERTGLIDSSECIDCPPGHYCNTAGKSSITGSDLCTAGYFCKIGSKLSSPQVDFPGDSNGGRCIKGYYCPAGSAYAFECDGGYYCGTDELATPTGQCTAGYYCIGKSSSATPSDGTTGNICPAGFYCPTGSISPTPCPKGTYIGSTGRTQLSDCLACPTGKYCGGVGLSTYTGSCQAGFYCVSGSYELMPKLGKCTAGHYCPAGSATEKDCPAGKYQDLTQQSSCKSCPAGYYCPISAMTTPTLCEAGFYCPASSSAHLSCPSGTYSSLTGRVRVGQCTTCPSGYYCTGGLSAPDGLCSAGYYCLSGAVSPSPTEDAQGAKCPKGYYCPSGSVSPIKCTPGKYCGTTTLSTPTGDCLQGYYCMEGASIVNPRDGTTGAICPAGYYCPTGSSYPIPCDIGYVQSSQGATSSSNCDICTQGYYCATKAATSFTGLCKIGYFCPTGSTAQDAVANICPKGSSCPSGSPVSVLCEAGYYQDQIGQGTCKDCPRGFYCDAGTITPTVCPAGYICPIGTSSTTLVSCEYGYYNPFDGQSECFICPMGYFCPAGPLTAPTVCEVNYYCVEGTSTPEPTCTAGTYTDETGIQSKDQCKQCPVGYYCTSGIVTGQCDAGYYCVSGTNTATPDSYTNTGTGYPCPVGHYCLVGTLIPTPCPEGKFRVSTGGTTVDDCTYCEEGYYCIPNNPIPFVCPTGAYCPAGSSSPLLCPSGYYSSSTQASSDSVCIICPAGYICDRAGIGNYLDFPCTPGYYCPTGAQLPVISPVSYYSPGANAGSIADLISCPSGYFCEEMSTGYQMCSVGTYCPEGTFTPTNCNTGYFCDYQSAEPSTCPTGWYCQEYVYPMDEYLPLLCEEGSICQISTSISAGTQVRGTIVPSDCSAGYYAIMARDVSDGVINECIECSPGTYSYASSVRCTYCDAGFVCLAGATIPNPTDQELYNGYQCGSGYFCPSGVTAPIPCPQGTYSTSETLGSIDECSPCPVNTYNIYSAATFCFNCSSSSYSPEGSSTCTCSGLNRVYLNDTSTCVCMNGYQYIASDGTDISANDGVTDCTRIVYPRCNTGEVRDELGNCRSTSDCSAACAGGLGERLPSTGICQCQDVDTVDSACDLSCRESAITYTYGADGNIVEYDPTTGTSTIISPSEINGFSGSLNCDSSYGCSIYSAEYDGSFQSNYGTSTIISRRRRLADTVSISNPVVCLSKGESMIFAVIPQDHYPVYLSKSLLNSNPEFDYSAFDTLASDVESGKDIKSFGFTFITPGIYIFADKTDTDQQIIIGVMDSNKQCPFSGANIQPRMTSSIHLIGAKLDSNIVLTVDWYVVYSTMGFLVLAIIIFAGLFYYYTLLTWSVPPLKHIRYRDENMKFAIKGDEGTRTTMKMVIDGKEASSSGSEAEEIKDMMFEKVPDQAQYELGEGSDEKQTIDAALMQAIKDKIRDNNALFLEFLDENEQDVVERMKRLEDETAELRNLLKSLLDPVAIISGKKLQQYQKNLSLAYDSANHTSAPSEADFQEALNEINSNAELLENDKQKLMNELNSELSKLDQNLRLEKSKHDEELNKKLAARALRKKEMEKKKQELEVEEKQTIKKHQNEVWQIGKEIENDEQLLAQEITNDKFDLARQVHGQLAVDLQNKLREGLAINPEKQQELMRQYEQEIQACEKNLTMNQIKQQQDLAKRIEEKKRQRRAAMKEKELRMQGQLENQQKLELEELRKRKMEIEAQEVVASVMPVISEVSEHKEVDELKLRQKEELLNAEKQLKDLEEQEVSKLMRNTSVNESKLANQKAALEKQKKELQNSFNSASNEDKEEMMKYLKQIEGNLKDVSEQQSAENKKNLDARLEVRRQKREEKLKELKEKQEKERLAAENAAKERQKHEKASSLDKAIKEALGKLPEEQKDQAIQALLEEKHESERLELQKKLKRKLRDRQRDAIKEVMRMKANDLELLRNEFREKLKAAGRDAETSMQIQKEEAEALNKLDYYYMKKLEGMQEEAWRDQQKKNQDELLMLIDSQLGEMRKHLRKQDPKKHENEEKLQKERESIEKEGKEKIEMLEKQKKELEDLKAQKQKELEEMIMNEQQREEKERRLKLALEKKRSIMERQRKEKEELMKRGKLSKEQMERLISDHQKELDALEAAIARERDRQIAVMSQKLAEKRSRKKEYESSMLRMKEEQDKWQKELEELPGISNKQATTLLLKWRRYPKKGIKDIEKSLKTNEPSQRILPVVTKKENVPTKKVADSRLEELLWRIEKIESTVDNVDTNQLSGIMKTISGIEQRVRNIKK